MGTKSWTYRTTLEVPEAPPGSKFVLAFDGLDTFAEVRLDGHTILKSDNMFLPHRVDITRDVCPGSGCVLSIDFDSALLRAREIEKQHPEHKFIAFNGETARVAVRKAQYHWGWDWGPVLMCAGIWRPIRLEIYTARISDIRTDVDVAADHTSAKVLINAEVESTGKHKLHVKVSAEKDGKTISENTGLVSSAGNASVELRIDQPALWMPAGYGSQHLYNIVVSLSSTDELLDTDSRRIGLRTVQLVQQPDAHGKSFFFRINGVDIFCGGSCWIPADSFVTNVTPERYRSWIELMVPANQKMIR